MVLFFFEAIPPAPLILKARHKGGVLVDFSRRLLDRCRERGIRNIVYTVDLKNKDPSGSVNPQPPEEKAQNGYRPQ